MKYSFLTLLASAALFLAMAMGACDDSSDIGNSLGDEDLAIVVDSAFTLTAVTVDNPVVQSRTTSQLLGALQAPGYGDISSDFVAQYMPSVGIDTVSMTAQQIDSVKLFIQMARGNFAGDSLVPMGLEVYRITRDLPYPIYSDFDPAGYYDTKPMASTVYTASTKDEPDSIKNRSAIAAILTLPLEFGRELYSAYMADPAKFSDPAAFARDVFKGFYVRSSYGSGRISDFTANAIRLYYHKREYNTDSARWDTTWYAGDYFSTAPEMVINNNIKVSVAPELRQMVAAGDNVIMAPAGLELDVRFPAPEIIASYNRHADRMRILNSLTFRLPADSIANDYAIGPPPYVLMVLKKDKDKFFAENSVNDNKTSFYAEYDATNGCYTFGSMREYLLNLLAKDEVTADDYTFTICPVQVNLESSAGDYYGTSYVVSSIVPYVSKPVMARISPSKAKIKLTFSSQNNNIL